MLYRSSIVKSENVAVTEFLGRGREWTMTCFLKINNKTYPAAPVGLSGCVTVKIDPPLVAVAMCISVLVPIDNTWLSSAGPI